MRITFWGAAGEVTGSCYLVETDQARVMVDCGIHQGYPEAEARNRRVPWKRDLRLDAVVLTHAHLDHSGRLPLINRLPGEWRTFATPATAALTDILLEDSARLQEQDTMLANRRRARAGKPLLTPLYTPRDAAESLSRLKSVAYQTPTQIAPGITIRFVDAGHILGSTSVEMIAEDAGRTRTIAFSADIGVPGSPLLADPTPLDRADVVMLESTYGDRDHRPMEQTLDELTAILREAERDGEKVLIPAFAVGRTQNLIYHMAQLHREGRINNLPVYIDSPMAIAATRLYLDHVDILDADARRLAEYKSSLLRFPTLRYSQSADDSRRLNDLRGAAVIIAGSGMCNGGRIVHHLRHNLWKPGVHVVFTGFQGQGTLGRELVQRPSSVRIFGETVAVKARIHTLGGLSAHGGQSTLVDWASHLVGPGKPTPRFFLTHGEDGPRAALAGVLRNRLKIEAERPVLGQTVDV
ncbi:MAG: MBL fold metallo-hydrolase [Phycisphaerales bacterium]|nr:MBL fold metallo-hydrolase [Phycisphaerales bacterium]